MKFESFLYVAAFLVLGLISLPTEANDQQENSPVASQAIAPSALIVAPEASKTPVSDEQETITDQQSNAG